MAAAVAVAAVAVVGGCGDDVHRDLVTGGACKLGGYPPTASWTDVRLTQPTPLALDGAGPRCEQIARALAASPRLAALAALAEAEAGFAIAACSYLSDTDSDLVRLRKATFAGAPLYGAPQELVVHVRRAGDVMTTLLGQYLPASLGLAVGAPCRGPAEVGAAVVGGELEYQRFQSCALGARGRYLITADDAVEVEAAGWYVDGERRLRRAYQVQVYLAAPHVDEVIQSSDLYCCVPGGDLGRCAGKALLVDALTGEVVGSAARCIVC